MFISVNLSLLKIVSSHRRLEPPTVYAFLTGLTEIGGELENGSLDTHSLGELGSLFFPIKQTDLYLIVGSFHPHC